MQAAVFEGIAGEISVRDVTLRGPSPGEVEVAISAAGVCHSDLHVVRTEWSVPTPIVLGHEGSGVVVDIGDGVEDLAVGDHVVLAWMASCRECRYCLAGRPAQCAKWNEVIAARGVLFDGTSRLTLNGAPAHHHLGVSSFAERAVVPASGAIRVRDDAPLDLLALLGCAVATGVGAVFNTARVPEGATVAVIAVPRLSDLDEGVDLAVVQVRTDRVLEVVKDGIEAGVKAFVIPGAGTTDSGQQAAALVVELQTLHQHHGIAVFGPNCMGVLDTVTGAAPYIGTVGSDVRRGTVGLVAQSGAIVEAFVNAGHSRPTAC